MNLETLRAEIVDNRATMRALNTKVDQYFDEVHNNWVEADTKVGNINTKADQIKCAINGLSEKLDIWMSSIVEHNSRIEQKIIRIERIVSNWAWKL